MNIIYHRRLQVLSLLDCFLLRSKHYYSSYLHTYPMINDNRSSNFKTPSNSNGASYNFSQYVLSLNVDILVMTLTSVIYYEL